MFFCDRVKYYGRYVCSLDTRYQFNDHWIGLMRGEYDDCNCTLAGSRCTVCKNSYVWSDGLSISYHSWSDPTQPASEDCVRLRTSGWESEVCDTYLQYICERGASDFCCTFSIL